MVIWLRKGLLELEKNIHCKDVSFVRRVYTCESNELVQAFWIILLGLYYYNLLFYSKIQLRVKLDRKY